MANDLLLLRRFFVRIDMSNKSGALGKYIGNKGNKKITELPAILQRESQNS